MSPRSRPTDGHGGIMQWLGVVAILSVLVCLILARELLRWILGRSFIRWYLERKNR